MAWRAEFGNELSVYRDGVLLGRAPTKAAERTLIFVLARAQEWLRRGDLAELIYPGAADTQANAALRQTLRRTRMWLGDEALRFSGGCVRLSEDWTVTMTGAGGLLFALPADLAADIRSRWLQSSSIAWPHQEFAALVRATAAVDIDDARAILVGGNRMLYELSAPEADDLLRLTRPAGPGSPQASMYHLLLAAYEHGSFQIAKALDCAETALGVAVEQGQRADARSIAAQAIFSAAELGGEREFDRWRTVAREFGQSDLGLQHAVAAYTWNQGDYGSAMTRFANMREIAVLASRAERLHYWTNYYVLCAESGAIQEAIDARRSCEVEDLKPKDTRWKAVLSLGDAWFHLALKQPAQAVEVLSSFPSRGWRMFDLYAAEIMAFAHADSGNAEGARHAWRERQRAMARAGVPPNLRRRRLAERLRRLLP